MLRGANSNLCSLSMWLLECFQTDFYHKQSKKLLVSEGRTVIKCLCECHQSRRRVVFDPELVAMSTTCSVSALCCSVSLES